MEKNVVHWDRKSRIIWTTTLFFGCLFVYCTRTTMSICAVQMGRELGWDKRISVSFTQILFSTVICSKYLFSFIFIFNVYAGYVRGDKGNCMFSMFIQVMCEVTKENGMFSMFIQVMCEVTKENGMFSMFMQVM